MYVTKSQRRKHMAGKKKTKPEKLIISIPSSSMSEQAMGNLRAMVKTKEVLIKKALGTESLDIEVENGKISFPWFDPAVENGLNVYSTFITALCDTARRLNRVNSKEEKTLENEKYAFRCFLLRIGFVGDAYKEARKVLLKNFSGSSAFKSGPKKTQEGSV